MKTPASHLWNQKAQEYSAMAASKDEDALEYEINFPSILSLCPKNAESVLDVGSGSGDFTKILKDQYKNVEGCDVSPNMVDIAQKKYPDIPFYVQDLEEDFSITYQYDVVICKLVLMFVEDLKHASQQLYKITKPGGFTIISVPHPTYWFTYYLQNKYKFKNRPEFEVLEEGYFTEKPIHKEIGGNKSLTFDFIHRTLATYVNTFNDAGFCVDRIDEPKFSSKYIKEYPNLAQGKEDLPMRLNIRFIK